MKLKLILKDSEGFVFPAEAGCLRIGMKIETYEDGLRIVAPDGHAQLFTSAESLELVRIEVTE